METSLPNGPASVSLTDKEQIQALIVEQGQILQVIVDLSDVIKNSSFQGRDSNKIAVGLSMLNAMVNQNKGHVENLRARLKGLGGHG